MDCIGIKNIFEHILLITYVCYQKGHSSMLTYILDWNIGNNKNWWNHFKIQE